MGKFSKSIFFFICLIPFGVLVFDAVSGQLGANPIEAITHFTGIWTLHFLLITLSITPLRRLTRINAFIRYRRMLGLYVSFYASLHFLSYLILDHFFDWQEIIRDIVERPYITVGFSAFIMLLPLTVTSTKKMRSRLGRTWQQLHRLIYAIAILGILHFLWLVKADLLEPLVYAGILALLLLLRLPRFKFSPVAANQPSHR